MLELNGNIYEDKLFLNDYESFTDFIYNRSVVKMYNGGYILIDDNNNNISFLEYSKMRISGERVIVNNGDGYQILDLDGNLLNNNLIFEEIGDFHEGYVKVKINGKWGFADISGQIKIPCIYKNVDDFHNERAWVQNDNGLYGCIEPSSKLIIDFNYQEAEPFIEISQQNANSLILSKVKCFNDKYGFVNKNGSVVIPFIFNNVRNFSDDFAAVQYKSLWGFVSLDNCKPQNIFFISNPQKEAEFISSMPVAPQYSSVYNYSEGFATVHGNLRWTHLDKLGSVDVKEYSKASSFSEGLCAVEINKKWGFIDTDKNLVIKAIYDSVNKNFKNGVAIVSLNGKFGLIDREGKNLTEFKYDEIGEFVNGYAIVIKDGLCGFIDINGNEIIPCEYLSAGNFQDGLATVQLNKKGSIEYSFIDAHNTRYTYDQGQLLRALLYQSKQIYLTCADEQLRDKIIGDLKASCDKKMNELVEQDQKGIEQQNDGFTLLDSNVDLNKVVTKDNFAELIKYLKDELSTY